MLRKFAIHCKTEIRKMIKKKNILKKKNIFKFNHYGIALKTFKNSLIFYKSLGYSIKRKFSDYRQNVDLILLEKNNFPTIELVKARKKISPLNSYLKNHDNQIYHVCYQILKKNFDIENFLKKYDYIFIIKLKANSVFSKKFASFYYIKGIGLIEFLHD